MSPQGTKLTVLPSLAALALWLAAVVVITATASPRVFVALHRAGFTGADMEGVTLRILELTAIALTFPLLAALGVGGRDAWGVPPLRGLARRVSLGVLIGIGSLAPVCAIRVVLGVGVAHAGVDFDAAFWLDVTLRAALAAAVIAVLEEFWFRGGLFTALQHTGGTAVALWGGAAFYAAVHFLDAPDMGAASGEPPGFGLRLLAAAGHGVFQAENVDSFVALLLAGVALGLARLRSGDVALAIGIHAGWVLTIKVCKKATYLSPDSALQALAGHYDGVIGWLAAAALGALALAIWRLPRRDAVRT